MAGQDTRCEVSAAREGPRANDRADVSNMHASQEQECEQRRQVRGKQDRDCIRESIKRIERQQNHQSCRQKWEILNIRPERRAQQFARIPRRQRVRWPEQCLACERHATLMQAREIRSDLHLTRRDGRRPIHRGDARQRHHDRQPISPSRHDSAIIRFAGRAANEDQRQQEHKLINDIVTPTRTPGVRYVNRAVCSPGSTRTASSASSAGPDRRGLVVDRSRPTRIERFDDAEISVSRRAHRALDRVAVRTPIDDLRLHHRIGIPGNRRRRGLRREHQLAERGRSIASASWIDLASR